MDRIVGQSRLSELPEPKYKTKPPMLLLNWNHTRPDLKKFIYLHIIRVAGEYENLHLKLTLSKLINDMARNSGIVKEQFGLYVENLLFYGYLLETHLDGEIIVSDKLYDDLQKIDMVSMECVK